MTTLDAMLISFVKPLDASELKQLLEDAAIKLNYELTLETVKEKVVNQPHYEKKGKKISYNEEEFLSGYFGWLGSSARLHFRAEEEWTRKYPHPVIQKYKGIVPASYPESSPNYHVLWGKIRERVRIYSKKHLTKGAVKDE